MVSKIFSAFPYGLEAKIVEIEVEVEPGLRAFHLIGLADEAVKEAAKRVNAALRLSGFKAPSQMSKKVIVNLAPADVKKQGSFFDFAIAIGFLVASDQIPSPPSSCLFIGELSLEGALRPVPGVLGITRFAQKKGFLHLFLPLQNSIEACLVSGITPIGMKALGQIREYLYSQTLPSSSGPSSIVSTEDAGEYDFFDIQGQEYSKRALEIAAAGGHHLFMVGPPGAGKSILARSFPSLLPPLRGEEVLEVATILSSFQPLSYEGDEKKVLLKRPFRSPHHTASAQAVLGGGSPPRPGEITLAHRGVLFLDEVPEFRRDVLEGLRQPLEDKVVRISRSNDRFTFPANFQLLGASNPCPCGFKDDPKRVCICTPGSLNRYERKLSGPLVDRIDLFVFVPPLTREQMLRQGSGSRSSKEIRNEVEKARKIQANRFNGIKTNSEMNIQELKRYCPLDEACKTFLASAIDRFALSMRAYHKLLKASRTIADLEGSKPIRQKHLSEAVQYRHHTRI